MSGKRLSFSNGDVRDYQECSDCHAADLRDDFSYCPYCGSQLHDL
jgi:RNA polymerase subunit RPABC4/transcription elongation factor Spt4